MKQIIFLRHAKSKWNKHFFDDFNRPLAKKGVMDAILMSNYLATLIRKINLVLSSSSQRTKETLKHFYPGNFESITFTKSLYHADKKFIMKLLANLNSKNNVVMLVGHNPGLHEAVETLSKHKITRFPTCALALISFDNPWERIEEKESTLELFLKPSDLR